MMNNRAEEEDLNGSEVAIIGMSGRFPGAQSVAELWANLCDGVESLSTFSEEELELAGVDPQLLRQPNYVRAGMVLEGAELFDASFFGYSPREAEVMDPQHRLLLECAWEALEHAGYNPGAEERSIGVFAGAGAPTYLLNNILSNPERAEAAGNSQISMGNGADFLTTRISYKLNLKGPSYVINCACSTSLVAIHHACQSILNGECDMALAGGASINSRQKMGYLYREGGISSPDGHCRAFDADARGTVGGNGVAVVALKSLEAAMADGDTIHAIIKGSAVNNDGLRKVGFTAPSIEGQAAVIAEALAMAGVEPETITYVEAHGTATPLGDPIEIAALTKAYRARTQKRGFCAVGSVKTNVGHLDTAAGVAGVIKTLLALKHGLLPPSLHYREPNPQIAFDDSPFYVNTSLSEWKRGMTKRRAGVSSFGVGGTNAHVILEEAPAPRPSGPSRSWQLLTVSARTPTALGAATANLADYLRQHTDTSLADIAFTRAVGRKEFGERRAVVCRDAEDAVNSLDAGGTARVLTGSAAEDGSAALAFMFTGQGSQYVNMAAGLYDEEPAFRRQIDLCSELLTPRLGTDLRGILFADEARSQDAAARLGQTHLTQPALFVIEHALAELLMSWGLRPQAMIGHSLGEYVAACVAGVLSLEDALFLVAERGRMMQGLPGGAMLSVPLSEEEARPWLGRHLSLAAVNAPSFCVLAGRQEEIEDVEGRLAARGIESYRLRTSHAFHSKMFGAIEEKLVELFGRVELRPPRIPYISNLTGDWISEAEATDPRYWARQMCQPVRFEAGLRRLLKTPEMLLLEVGPGQTLCTLAKQQSNGHSAVTAFPSLRPPNVGQPDLAFLLNAVGQLWVRGVEIDWRAFYRGQQRNRLPLPTYPFERQRFWVEPRNHTQAAARPAAEKRIEGRRERAHWFYLPSWKRSELTTTWSPQLDDRHGDCCLVFVGPDSLSAQIVREVEVRDQRAISVKAGARYSRDAEHAYTINPGERGDYERLLRELAERGLTPKQNIHLWGVDETGPDDAFDKAQDAGFYSLLFLARALVERHPGLPFQMLIVTSGVQDVTGEEKLRPERATVLGPCRVIPQEYPNITCRSVDLIVPRAGSALEARIATQLIMELSERSNVSALAYRGTRRWVQHFEPARIEAEAGPSRLREEGVYVVTGGLGRIGLELASYLGRTRRARLALIARQALPAREEWESWLASHDPDEKISRRIRSVQALEAQGTQVLVLCADVGDEGQMRTVVEEVTARFGGIHGVIHAAGELRERLTSIHEIGPAEADKHFRPKVSGLLVLEKVFSESKPDFFLLFSSLSSILGGIGFGAYSAANIFMDSLAHRSNREDGIPWLSVNWDGWQLKQKGDTSHQAEPAITPDEGLEALERILCTRGITQVVITPTDLQTRLDRWINPSARPGIMTEAADAASASYPRPDLANRYVAPVTEIERAVAAIWQELMGIERIGLHDNFFELGGHSLMGVQLMSWLRRDFKIELPLRTLFESPTIAGLAVLIEQRLGEQRDVAVAPIPIERRESRTVEELLEELERERDEDSVSGS
jgi:acyl transferase domain-containing protein/acyl carrier protein